MTLRGITTLIYLVDDVAAATDWYTDLLGAGPFFTRPGPGGRVQYAKFAVGDSGAELAIADRTKAPPGTVAGPGGVIVHWRVADLDAPPPRLPEMGAEEDQGRTPPGAFVTPGVIDPLHNLLGPHGVAAPPHSPAHPD